MPRKQSSPPPPPTSIVEVSTTMRRIPVFVGPRKPGETRPANRIEIVAGQARHITGKRSVPYRMPKGEPI